MIYIVYITWMILQILVTALACLFVMLIFNFVSTKLQLYYKNWRIKKRDEKWQKECEEFIQRQRRWELKWKLYKEEIEKQRKEKEKYPLFYLKEGIV